MTDKKCSLVIGCRGQDGSLLFDLLSKRGDKVIGIDRGLVQGDGFPALPPIDVCRPQQVDELIAALRPMEIYYLAARHQSSEEATLDARTLYEESVGTNVTGLFHCLEAIRRFSPTTRIFYAASSHIFGDAEQQIQDETTPLKPNSIYGMTKVFAMQLCQSYRANHGIFATVGILYNHESSLRPAHFLSKKIISTALKIKAGLQDTLTVGSLSSATDWGYAPEYVEAMTRILALPKAHDFVVASGRSHTVRDFVEFTFSELGLNWQKHVQEQPGLLVRRSATLIGNPRRLREATGWQATVDLKAMISLLLQAESLVSSSNTRSFP